MPLKSIRYSSGFSLLEILIGVGVIAVIIGGGIASYRRFDDRQKVVSAGRNFVIELRSTQQLAQSGQKPTDCTGQTLGGWILQVTSATAYRIVASCNGAVVNSSQQLKTLPENTEFSDQSFQILYEVLNGQATVTGLSGTPPTFFIQDSEGNYQYTIEMTSVGGINDLGVQ